MARSTAAAMAAGFQDMIAVGVGAAALGATAGGASRQAVAVRWRPRGAGCWGRGVADPRGAGATAGRGSRARGPRHRADVAPTERLQRNVALHAAQEIRKAQEEEKGEYA